MIPVDAAVAEALGKQSAATALGLRITRADGLELGLTDHDQRLTFSGTVFLAEPGMTLSGGLELTADLAPDNAEIATALHQNGITQADLDAERYATARAELWRLSTAGEVHGQLISVGTLGEIDQDTDHVVIEFRGLTHQLARVTGRVYQRSCDAQLGDERCGVDLAQQGWLRLLTLTEQDGLRLTLSGALPDDFHAYVGGGVRVTSGDLAGLSRPIRTLRASAGLLQVTLWRELPSRLSVGTQIELSPGCDKRLTTCQQRFSNAKHFCGFPYIPGTDVLAVVRSSQ